MTKITIVLPYYTPDDLTKRLFQRCVDSIDPRFEVITVEDEEQLGPGATRNEGLDRALNFLNYQPDYVTFLDADDTLAPDAYDQMVKAIEEAPDDAIIQMNHIRVFPDGTQKPRMWNKKGTYYLDRLPQLWVSSVNKLYKADLLQNIKFKNFLNHGEDELFVLECLAKARRLYNSDRVALHYHKDNPNSLSTVTSFQDLYDEQMALLEFIDEHNEDKELCDVVRRRQVELWNNPVYKRLIGGAE